MIHLKAFWLHAVMVAAFQNMLFQDGKHGHIIIAHLEILKQLQNAYKDESLTKIIRYKKKIIIAVQ